MTSMTPTSAKIIQHSEGLGVPDSEMVRRRAKELAIINGHRDFTEQDWRAAKHELHGGHEMNDTNGDHEMTAEMSEHDMVIGSLGHHTQKMMPDDNENVLEELIAEGIDEAVHEQMLASRQADQEEEENDPTVSNQ